MPISTQPKVTVCIPCHNHMQFVEDAVESVIAQDVDDLCIILSDDSSTDGSAAKCRALKKKYPHIIDLILHEENIGIQANFHSLEERINPKTGFLTWLAADDIFLPGKLKKQMDFLDHHPDHVACYHDVCVKEDNLELYNYNHPLYGQQAHCGDITEKLIEYGCFISGVSLLIRWNPDFNLTQNMPVGRATDWLYSIRVSMLGKIGYLDEILGVYRRHPGNITRQDILAENETPVYNYLLEKHTALEKSIEKGQVRSNIALMGKSLLLRNGPVFTAQSKKLFKQIYHNPFLLFYCIKMIFIMGVQRLTLFLKTGSFMR